MARIKNGRVGNLAQTIVQRPIQLLWVATGEVGSATTVEEERVTGDEAVVDEEALAARRVAWRVDQFDLDLANLHNVARIMADEMIRSHPGHLGDVFDLGCLQMHRNVDTFEQLGDAVDGVAHHVSAHMVGVIVGSEHAGEGHSVSFENVEQAIRVVCGIDHNRLTGLGVTNDVTEVDHLLRDRIVRGEISPGEQLTEIEAAMHSATVAIVSAMTQRRIAYLGPEGTFTEEALRSQPDLLDAEFVPMRTFVDVLNATQDGDVDLGFVAIENAIEGTVNVTLDTLAFDTDLAIQREVVLDIEMHLMAAPGTSIDDVHTVTSHPVANAQCRAFLRSGLPDADVQPANSTAEGARIAAETPGVAALGPRIAGERHGLEILASDVADMQGNQTRFLVVAPDGVPSPSGHDKTTLVLNQRVDKPGSLVAILHEFSARNLNLSKLTSRPARTTLGQYCFIVDVFGHIADDVMANCLTNIHAKHADVKFLGSYPTAGDGSLQVRAAASEAWDDAEKWMQTLRDQIA